MQTSDEQFRELMAHLVARGNRALAQHALVPPMNLLLLKNGDVSCSVGVADTPDELKRVVEAMQQSLREQVRTEAVVATCVASFDPENGKLIALLENHENYCAKVTVPAVQGSRLDMENMQIDGGYVCVFPMTSDN